MNTVKEGTAAELRRLAAKRDRQEQALEQTRRQIDKVMRRAVEREHAPGAVVARLAGVSRMTTWRARQKV